VRELRVLAPARLSVLAQRRASAPSGADGGEDGAPGRTLVNGEALPASASRDLEPGDLLRVETPGGGGHGRSVS
jgi:N-methylhydantoinase B/oxoprolinase/acetone carboxylase alpha subunit